MIDPMSGRGPAAEVSVDAWKFCALGGPLPATCSGSAHNLVFATRKAAIGPSLHSLQRSIIPAFGAIAVTAWPNRHDPAPLGGAPSPALARDPGAVYAASVILAALPSQPSPHSSC
jgi:hypothetical protein